MRFRGERHQLMKEAVVLKVRKDENFFYGFFYQSLSRTVTKDKKKCEL
jgi:hypothetical protein